MESHIQTKLIATLGPASASEETLKEMFDVGLDVCRLNFSHGTHAEHEHTLRTARRIAEERQKPITVLGDLSGPKIRLNEVSGERVELRVGKEVRIERGTAPCTAERLTVNYDRFVDEVEPGQRIYIDDGLLRLLVIGREKDVLVCRCTAGGEISAHKGVNLPDTALTVPALTDKDRRDLEWALAHDLDFVALSFVRRPEDLDQLRSAVEGQGGDVGIIAKIEKTEAIEQLDAIIARSDAILIARGDLGVEMDIWRLPLVQKDITRRCRARGVPVIVATQMLQSMVSSPQPTRAEVSDVGNAILDRADAVMLSAETAVGRYPGLAVDMMNRIAGAAEMYLRTHEDPAASPQASTTQREVAAIAHAAVAAARDTQARLVAVWSATGATVRFVTSHRLGIPVVGVTFDERVARRMNLLYGVIPLVVPPLENPAEMADALDRLLLRHELASPGDLAVVVTSTQPRTPGSTDTALIHRVSEGRGGD